MLPKTSKYVFEFRNASWFTKAVYKILREANVGLCQAENESMETPHVITADFVYLRLRKPDYSESELMRSNAAPSSIFATATPLMHFQA